MKFKVNGNEVFASTGGRPFDKNKPLIIFVHGSGLTHMTWVLQTRYFAFHGYTCLALDMPGHGLSAGKSLKSIEDMADWINSVIDAVGFKEASLVGHSQGCLVTIECTARYPEKIKTLSLMGGAGAIPMNPELLALAEKWRSKSSRFNDGLGTWSSRSFWWSPSSRIIPVSYTHLTLPTIYSV